MPEDLSGIDVSRLDALTKLEADQRALQALVEKATRRRDKELEVYARVVADYEHRATALVQEADSVRRQVRGDFQKIEALFEHATEALNQARVQLQECEFRHGIGEYTDEEFKRCEQTATRAVEEREAEFENVRKLQLRYLDLLKEEEHAPPPKVAAPVIAAPPVAAAPHAAPSRPASPPSAKAAPPSSVKAAAPPAVKAAAPQAVKAAAPQAVKMPPPSEQTEAPTRAVVPPEPEEEGKTMFIPAPGPADFKVPLGIKGDDEDEDVQTVVYHTAFLIEDRDGLPGASHRLGPRATIGRGPDNDVVVAVQEASRRHAEIAVAEGQYFLKDLGSPNGTFVNGERVVEKRRLKEGDKITLGGKAFVFKAP